MALEAADVTSCGRAARVGRDVVRGKRELRREATRLFFVELDEVSDAVQVASLAPRVVGAAEACPSNLVHKAAVRKWFAPNDAVNRPAAAHDGIRKHPRILFIINVGEGEESRDMDHVVDASIANLERVAIVWEALINCEGAESGKIHLGKWKMLKHLALDHENRVARLEEERDVMAQVVALLGGE